MRTPIFENDPGGVFGELIDCLREFQNGEFVWVAEIYWLAVEWSSRTMPLTRSST